MSSPLDNQPIFKRATSWTGSIPPDSIGRSKDVRLDFQPIQKSHGRRTAKHAFTNRAATYSTQMIVPRQQEIMRTLWLHGRLSRSELHDQTGVTHNTVGVLVDELLHAGLVRECAPESARMGRPRIPVEIDSASRHVIGLALLPGRAEVTRLTLSGTIIDSPRGQDIPQPDDLIAGAAALLTAELAANRAERTVAVGVTVTGFVDPVHKRIIFSSAIPSRSIESLTPVFDSVGKYPAVLGNDMQGLAARWMLTHRAEPRQDVLLVNFMDGRLGSALLIDGRPNRGSVTGGNELGHTRFPVDTDRCFCGETGCVERIVSTEFLHRLDRQATTDDRTARPANGLTLADRVARFESAGGDEPLNKVMGYLAMAISNAVNFIRPHRLVLVSPLTRHSPFTNAISTRIRALILPGLSDRLQIDTWHQPSTRSAENAAWLAMAELLYGGWDAGDVAG